MHEDGDGLVVFIEGITDTMRLWYEGGSFVLLLNQYEIKADGTVTRPGMAYASHDSGTNRSAVSLDFTTITTRRSSPLPIWC